MVSHKPKKRPTFKEILEHPFLKEVNNVTKEQEIQIKKELEDLYNNHIKKVTKVYKSNDDIINNEHLITRAGESKGDVIFENKKLEPKKISKDRLLLNQAIEINGNISEVDFMNSLYRDIKHKFEKHSYLKASKDRLNMEVAFEYEENEEEEKEEKEEEKEEKEEEDEKEEKEEEKELEMKEEKEHFEDCKMEIELYEYEKGKYLLEFMRTGGQYSDYYQHFLEIKKIALILLLEIILF